MEDEACLEIRPAAAVPPATPPKPATPAREGLTMSVEGLSNPVRAGKELTYEIVVENKGTASCRQVGVTATVPDGMVPDKLGTGGPGGPATVKVDRQVVSFDPVAELRPNESLTYRVRVQAVEAGKKSFRVELRTVTASAPLVQEASTEVI